MDVTEPSALASAVLTARPYAFLDDAPLEERRTQAVMGRRWLGANQARDLAALDAAAIDAVTSEAWPDPRDKEEMHDALVLMGFVTSAEVSSHALGPLLDLLVSERRASPATVGEATIWVAAERLPELLAAHETAQLEAPILAPSSLAACTWTRESAVLSLLRSRLEVLGPVTLVALATSLAIDETDARVALAALEAEGFCFRGSFRGTAGDEYCERRLLARIHRRTLDRLRREIEPVSAGDFLRMLQRWQRVAEPIAGAEGLEMVLGILQGFEAPAGAWESEILLVRASSYDPSWLDMLGLSGRVVWGRLGAQEARGGSVRTSPMAIVSRDGWDVWHRTPDGPADGTEPGEGGRVLSFLEQRGPGFFGEILRGTGLVRSQLEQALGELARRGRVTSDSFAGLRALLLGSKDATRGRARGRRLGDYSLEAAGRWSLLRSRTPGPAYDEARVEAIARALLKRWGVVMRRIIDREGALPPWRDLLVVYRRLEARGEIRGGRFVAGLTGEQYALPEAVELLRSTRRIPAGDEIVVVSAADPLNLVGILTPGTRVASHAGSRIALRGGIPVAVREGGETRLLEELSPLVDRDVRAALVRKGGHRAGQVLPVRPLPVRGLRTEAR
jgi:ATP-dependent Lhr-like helicase